MIGANGQAAFVRFAVARANFRLLDSMCHCVAHQVNQRIGNLLNNIVVELGFRAIQNQRDALARGLRRIAHGARKPRIEIADRHHARACDFVLASGARVS